MVNDVFLTTDLNLLFSGSDDTTAKVWKYDYRSAKYHEIVELTTHVSSI
jgi:hypothetical protein